MPGSDQRLLPAQSDQIAAVIHSLVSGELVILPTETVYAIAANLRSESALRRIEQLKPSTVQAPWVVHLSDADELHRRMPSLSPLAQRLVRKTWPGPVAYELPVTAQDKQGLQSWLGPAATRVITGTPPTWRVRCPDHFFTRSLLSRTQFPVILVGASLPGQPATDIAGISPSILQEADAIVDDGATRYKKTSTLVSVTDNRVQVVRPGVIDERIVDRLADFVILFVCSGNTCRSPMAMAIARKVLADRLGVKPEDLGARRVRVLSAGVFAGHGMPATPEAVVAAAEQHGDLSGHFSQPATAELLRRADVVYTMTESHREEILARYPDAAAKTFMLDPDGDIEDPIGYDQNVYSQVASHLRDVIERRLSEIRL